MARPSITIAEVARPQGAVHIRLAGKRGLRLNSAADAQAIVDAFADSVSDETLIVLAIRKVGAANIDQLSGKTLTLSVDVNIA